VSNLDQIRDDVHQLCLAVVVGLPDIEAVASSTEIVVRVLVLVGPSAKVREDDSCPWLIEVGWAVELGLLQSGLVLFLPEESHRNVVWAGLPCLHGHNLVIFFFDVALIVATLCEILASQVGLFQLKHRLS